MTHIPGVIKEEELMIVGAEEWKRKGLFIFDRRAEKRYGKENQSIM